MHRRFVLVSVASEVAAAKGWLPGYFEFYFKGKAMAEAAVTEAAGEGNAYVVKPSFIYGGDSFELFPPRVASGYGAAIEEILSNAIITKIADVLPGLLKVALRPPSSVDAVAEACVRCAVGDCATTVLDGTVAINDAAGADKATAAGVLRGWAICLRATFEWHCHVLIAGGTGRRARQREYGAPIADTGSTQNREREGGRRPSPRCRNMWTCNVATSKLRRPARCRSRPWRSRRPFDLISGPSIEGGKLLGPATISPCTITMDHNAIICSMID